MPTTRSSARKAGATSPDSSPATTGNKRKAEASPASSPATASKKSTPPKKQKTIEETLPDAKNDDQDLSKGPSQDAGKKHEDGEAPTKANDESVDTDMKDVESEDTEAPSKPTVDIKSQESPEAGSDSPKKSEAKPSAIDQDNSKSQANGDHKLQQSEALKPESSVEKEADQPDSITDGASARNHVSNGEVDQANTNTASTTDNASSAGADHSKDLQSGPSTTNGNHESTETSSKPTEGDAVQQSSQREKATPSSILEKGIIYFFFRGRVGIDEPSDVNDIARSYIVLRPLPLGAKLTDGPIGDQNNLRVLALPKKVLPKGPNDRFMVFVDKSKANLEDLKKEFLSASDYDTKTAGTRHTPAATPIGEGVYALTSTGRETHLAYVLTIPKELSEVQKDIGLEAKGSWVTSVKNPQHAGPAQAQLPNDPKFPQEILDEFRSLRWGQLQPKHLDYENCQLLVIGHKDHSFAKATETEGKETDPREEIEKLGEEDERRVEHLQDDDTVFEDLNIDAKEYPSVQTTW